MGVLIIRNVCGSEGQSPNHKIGAGAIAGIVIGVLCAALIYVAVTFVLVFLLVLLFKKKHIGSARV